MDKQTVHKVASLAKIALNEEETEKLVPQLSGIIGWIEQLAEVNTENVEPLASVVEIPLQLRPDEQNDGGYADKVLKNAPEETQGFFVVPKIVEQEE